MVTAPVPTRSRADELSAYAASLAAELAPRCDGRLSTALVGSGWVELRIERLAARDGRQDALLCPRAAGGFVVVIDPELSPADREAGRDLSSALDWRIAHELGHAFFFDRGTPAQRWTRWSPAEEEAADFVAAALLRELALSG